LTVFGGKLHTVILKEVLDDDAGGFLHVGDGRRVRAFGHLLDDLSHFFKVGEAHGLELGVYLGPVDGDFEGGPASDLSVHLRLWNASHDQLHQFHVTRPVASGAAVLDVDQRSLRIAAGHSEP